MPYRGPYLRNCPDLGERIVGGFGWTINKTSRGVTYLVCKDKLRKQCPATGRISVDGDLTTRRPHSHPSNPVLEQISLFIDALYDMVIRSLRPVKKVYEAIDFLYAEAARHVPYSKIRSSMQRWRKDAKKRPEPTSYSNLQAMLNSDENVFYRFYEYGTMRTQDLRVSHDKVAMVMGDAHFALPIQIHTLYVSTTTRVLPSLNNTQQVLFVIGAYQGYETTKLLHPNCIDSASSYLRAFPFAWALVKESDAETYGAILQYLRYDLAANVRNLVNDVYTDLDYKLRQQVTSKFYDANVHITFFDFCRVMLSFVGEQIDLENVEHAIVLRKFIGLALLPPGEIENGFTWLVNTMSQEINVAFAEFAQSFLNVFIGGLGTETLSFHWKLKAFEDVPQMHAQALLNRVGSIPNTWEFIAGLETMLEATVYNSIRLTEDPQSRTISTTPRIHLSIAAHKLKTLWTNYDTQTLPIDDFLACASFLTTEYFNDLKFQRETTVGHVIEHIIERPDGAGAADVGNLLREVDIATLPNQIRPFDANNDADINVAVFEEAPLLIIPAAEIQAEGFDDPYDWLCQKCKIQRVDQICVPCNHTVICGDCANVLRQTLTPDEPLCCPQCKEVAEMMRIFFPTNEADDWKCQVCNSAPLQIVVKPCFHAMICEQCSNAVQASAAIRAIPTRCPFCNVIAASFEHVIIQRR